MMRSMFSGISGLKGFQQAMDVIGNNIANVNTVGFKGGRTTFQSMMMQTIVGAKSPEEEGRGGVNALQIGLGTMMASVDVLMSQGSFQNTGKKTDLGIQGDGFFVLSDGIQRFYSRAGNFMLDESGHFVQPSTGLKLQGWAAQVDPRTGIRYLDKDKPPSDIFIAAGLTMPAKATQNMRIGGNLNSVVGIEPMTISVRNPNDPTKTYKVRFTFEKIPPFDTERLFSGGTVKYTWRAEIVDWNTFSPYEIPELANTIGMIELNQFGQLQRFLRYSTDTVPGQIGAAPFDGTIIGGDAERTWFNYHPTGGSAIEDAVVALFSDNSEGILDKIITKATFRAEEGVDYNIVPALTGDGQTVAVTMLNNIRPASGDLVHIDYFTREPDIAYTGQTSLTIRGPITDPSSLIVYSVDTGTATALIEGTDYRYNSSTGVVSFLSALPAGTDHIRLEYQTQDSFVGTGTTSQWTLSRPAILRPASLPPGLDTQVDIDMKFNVNETARRVEFRAPYPTADATKFHISYANPSLATDFDTIDVMVGADVKANISFQKTGDIKFYDLSDTQNFVTGVYESPRFSTATTAYDSLGKPYTVYLEFQKLKTNQWAWRAVEESGIPIEYVDDREIRYIPDPSDNTSIVGGILEFDASGRISAYGALRQDGQVETDISIIRIRFTPGEFVDDGAAPPPEEGAAPVSALLDFSELVQFANPFSATVREQDGNAMGVLQAFAINNIGQVVGTFTNGRSDVLAQLAMAIFNNPAGLMDMGNTLYSESANSGTAQIGFAGTGGRGLVSPGVLEMSNVDLAEEFTGMVIVQRAFQANARTITTADQILQELVNLKR